MQPSPDNATRKVENAPAYAAKVRVTTATALIHPVNDPWKVLVGDSEKHQHPVLPGGKAEWPDLDCDPAQPGLKCVLREVQEEVEGELIEHQYIGAAEDPGRDIRFVSPEKLDNVVVAPALPALPPDALVKAHYGAPDHLFVAAVDEKQLSETAELRNLRFIDIRSIHSGDLSAGHDVVVLWYRHMLENGLRTLPAGALKDFEADRARFRREEAEKARLSPVLLDPASAALVEGAISGAQRISKTLHGISDTSCSVEKEKLPEGQALESGAISNLRRLLTEVFLSGPLALETVADVRAFIESSARKLNEGLGGDPGKLWRTWTLEEYGRIPPERIRAEIEVFYQQFLELYNDKGAPATKAAAWCEYQFNGVLHPLTDGCGRLSVFLSAILLARENKMYPLFPSREEYYGRFGGTLEEWTAWYEQFVA